MNYLNVAYPKISVITPSFNQGQYIEQSIRSVIDQNYPNLEYIIIDGGSSDNTIGIIKKYEKYISYWVSEPDRGQTDGINKGFAKCSGDIVNWLNSDDYYQPDTFYRLAQLFIANPSVNIVCGKEWSFSDADLKTRTLNHGSIIENNVFETIRIGVIDQPCTFFRKACIKDFFPLDISLRYVMDRQLWWCYLLKYGQDNILKTDEIFTNFRLHPLSKSVKEANLFEIEFDRLKLSLFRCMNAPNILMQQIAKNEALDIKWVTRVHPATFVLAAFATFFAERQYIKKDLEQASKLINLVKEWKQHELNKKEWRLYLAVHLRLAARAIRFKK